ncbi:MAG: hypothetical protein LQ346_006064 [Caloplaca aetnensis]|nr:MAG: hypothetical protein LQ346_006064 [Caloplaca aetnensis]
MLIKKALPCLLLSILSLVQASPTRTLPVPDPSETDFAPDDNTCSDYKTCSSKGLRYWRELQAKLAEEHPIDVDVVASQETFNRDYRSEFLSLAGDDSPGPRNIRPELERHGFEWDWTEAFVTFSVNPETGKETEDTAYRNMFYTSKGLIVALENFRRLDEQKTLPFSEITYHTWQFAQQYAESTKGIRGRPGGGPISTLQTMVQVAVQNEETEAVIETIWEKNGWYSNEGDMTWYRFTLAESPLWFYALLGTVNVKGTVFLLKDHAAELGKKTITTIWVRWPKVDPDIWIDIGPYTPETPAVETS